MNYNNQGVQGSTPESYGENRVIKTPLNESKYEDQDQDQKRELEMIMSLWAQSKEHRHKYDKSWKDYHSYYNGDQWLRKPPSYRSAPNINIIRSTIQTIIPLLTDTSPGFDIVGKQPQDYQFGETLSKAVQDWWERSGMDVTLVEAITDSQIIDIGVIKVIWNENLENGLGEIACTVIDPDQFWVNPGCTDLKDYKWIIERMPKTIGELKRLFPEMKEKIRSGSDNETKADDNQQKTESGQVVLVSPVDRKSTIRNPQQVHGSSIDDYKTIDILECYIKDYTVEEYQLDSDEEEPKTESRLKYPNGKVVTVIPSLQLVLQSKENPYEDSRAPYVSFIDNIRARSLYGQGEVEPLIETQKLLNKVTSVILDYLNNMTNTTWVVDRESGVDPDMLTNVMGQIITKNNGTEVRRDPPPPMPGQVFDMYQMFQALADQQSGINDVTQGRKPTGITAAEAIQTMQEAAQTRIRLKERNLIVSLCRLGELVVSRMLQFYRQPRIVRMVGTESFWPTYFEFWIEPVEDKKYVMNKKEYQFDANNKEYIPTQDVPNQSQPTFGTFSVIVKGGTSLPFLRQQRSDLAIQLTQMQMIDQEALLSTLEWPHKEEIMNRMQQKQQQQAEMQQQQQPPQGGSAQ